MENISELIEALRTHRLSWLNSKWESYGLFCEAIDDYVEEQSTPNWYAILDAIAKLIAEVSESGSYVR